jgi:hypothetical protein
MWQGGVFPKEKWEEKRGTGDFCAKVCNVN